METVRPAAGHCKKKSKQTVQSPALLLSLRSVISDGQMLFFTRKIVSLLMCVCVRVDVCV